MKTKAPLDKILNGEVEPLCLCRVTHMHKCMHTEALKYAVCYYKGDLVTIEGLLAVLSSFDPEDSEHI